MKESPINQKNAKKMKQLKQSNKVKEKKLKNMQKTRKTRRRRKISKLRKGFSWNLVPPLRSQKLAVIAIISALGAQYKFGVPSLSLVFIKSGAFGCPLIAPLFISNPILISNVYFSSCLQYVTIHYLLGTYCFPYFYKRI